MWNEYAQAVANSVNAEPLLIIKKNKHKPLAVIDAEILFYLISMHWAFSVEGGDVSPVEKVG